MDCFTITAVATTVAFYSTLIGLAVKKSINE